MVVVEDRSDHGSSLRQVFGVDADAVVLGVVALDRVRVEDRWVDPAEATERAGAGRAGTGWHDDAAAVAEGVGESFFDDGHVVIP